MVLEKFLQTTVIHLRGHQCGQVWYHKNCEGLLYPDILPLLLCYLYILRYNASKRGRDFWDTLYIRREQSECNSRKMTASNNTTTNTREIITLNYVMAHLLL